jgi:hypothetical protein
MDKEKMKETLNEELSGSIDFDVLDVSEGQIIRLKDGTLLDPEVFISYFNDLSAFEEEFGPLEEAKEKLRELKKLEEEFGPVSEISEALNKLYEKAEALLESYRDEDEDEDDYLVEEELEDDEEEELDVSDLTVRQLLALLVTALLDDDEGADEDVDLEDLDLERIGDMTVGELLQLLREGKVEEVFEGKEKEGRGCGGNKSKNSEAPSIRSRPSSRSRASSIDGAIEKLFEEGEEGGIVVQPSIGMVEEPNKDMDDEEEKEKEKEKEKEEKEEQEDQENVVKVKEESLSEESSTNKTNENASGEDPFDLDIFKRLLDRLG